MRETLPNQPREATATAGMSAAASSAEVTEAKEQPSRQP